MRHALFFNSFDRNNNLEKKTVHGFRYKKCDNEYSKYERTNLRHTYYNKNI